jgi:hypothetical protein
MCKDIFSSGLRRGVGALNLSLFVYHHGHSRDRIFPCQRLLNAIYRRQCVTNGITMADELVQRCCDWHQSVCVMLHTLFTNWFLLRFVLLVKYFSVLFLTRMTSSVVCVGSVVAVLWIMAFLTWHWISALGWSIQHGSVYAIVRVAGHRMVLLSQERNYD